MNASCMPSATSAAVWMVRASLETGARIGGWSSSWSEPLPQRFCGARPPTTTSGEPLNCAWATALTPLVTPGPAVSTASPGVRVSLPIASAAKAAVCSWRTSRMPHLRVGGHRAVVHREDVGARQGEHRLDAVGPGHRDGVLARVGLHGLGRGVAGLLGGLLGCLGHDAKASRPSRAVTARWIALERAVDARGASIECPVSVVRRTSSARSAMGRAVSLGCGVPSLEALARAHTDLSRRGRGVALAAARGLADHRRPELRRPGAVAAGARRLRLLGRRPDAADDRTDGVRRRHRRLVHPGRQAAAARLGAARGPDRPRGRPGVA